MRIHRCLSFGKNHLLPLTLCLLTLAVTLGCVPKGAERTTGPGDLATASSNKTAESIPPADAIYVGEKACLECHEHADTHYSHQVHAKAFRGNPRTPQQG